MKLYISGPITGYPALNRRSFDYAEKALSEAGHEALNPFDCGLPDGSTWAEYLRADLAMVLAADGVCVLDGWQASRGACLEVHVAHGLGMTVAPLGVWLANDEGDA